MPGLRDDEPSANLAGRRLHGVRRRRAASAAVPLRCERHGRWGPPGGGVEHGEHPDGAVVREVREETGVDVKVVRLLGVHTNVWHPRGGDVQIHAVNLVYEAKAVGGPYATRSTAAPTRQRGSRSPRPRRDGPSS